MGMVVGPKTDATLSLWAKNSMEALQRVTIAARRWVCRLRSLSQLKTGHVLNRKWALSWSSSWILRRLSQNFLRNNEDPDDWRTLVFEGNLEGSGKGRDVNPLQYRLDFDFALNYGGQERNEPKQSKQTLGSSRCRKSGDISEEMIAIVVYQ